MDYPMNALPVMVKLWGEMACFARPEFPTERFSYLVPTPSAIRGVLESIYWKPEFHWRIREIRVLNPIKHFSETRNEIRRKASRNSIRTPVITDIGSNRLQRHSMCLKDVAYVVIAEPIPVPYESEMLIKHAQIFLKRVADGQCFSRPYFGSREWSCYFGQATGAEKPVGLTMSLGRMLFDQRYETPGMTYASHMNQTRADPIWFDAQLVDGVLRVPDSLYRYAGGCRGHEREQPEKATGVLVA